MKITPLDIQQKRFARVVRGYDRNEVEAFLAAKDTFAEIARRHAELAPQEVVEAYLDEAPGQQGLEGGREAGRHHPGGL